MVQGTTVLKAKTGVSPLRSKLVVVKGVALAKVDSLKRSSCVCFHGTWASRVNMRSFMGWFKTMFSSDFLDCKVLITPNESANIFVPWCVCVCDKMNCN